MSGYEDPLRRTQTYRVLKSQPSEPGGPRYLDRASALDATVYAPPLSITTRPPEPAAYLTLDLEISKASLTFRDALGGADVNGRRLVDVVAPHERDRVLSLRDQLLGEQRREQPNYLPPILDRGDQILQSLGFGPDDLSRYSLNYQEYLNFISPDGLVRPYPVRIGLAKEGSFFFVVALLNLTPPARHPYPSPSPHSRDGSSIYMGQPPPNTPQSAVSQRTPVSATFDPARHNIGDGSLPPRQATSAGGIASRSPGVSPGGPLYAANTPTRPDYVGPPPTFGISQGNPPPVARLPGQASVQLPPIRSQVEERSSPSMGESSQRREDRPSRVDIGGLIERPETPGRPQ